jgi:hypothetical protein
METQYLPANIVFSLAQLVDASAVALRFLQEPRRSGASPPRGGSAERLACCSMWGLGDGRLRFARRDVVSGAEQVTVLLM